MDNEQKRTDEVTDEVNTDQEASTSDTANTGASAMPTDETSAAPEATGASAAPAAAETGGKNRSGMIALGIVVVMVIIAVGAFWYQKTQTKSSADATAVTQSFPAVVATVNGEDVSRDDFMQSYNQALASAKQQGLDPTKSTIQSEIQKQAMTVVVNTVLMMQAAQKEGYTASADEIQKQFDQIKQQFGGEDQMKAALQKSGLTEDAVKADLKKQIIVEKYLKATDEWKNITVTDKEKHDLYDQVSARSSSTPPYSQVEQQVGDQIRYQKQQQATQTVVSRLRASSTIDVKI